MDESTQSQAILPTEPQANEWKHQRQEGRLGGGEWGGKSSNDKEWWIEIHLKN